MKRSYKKIITAMAEMFKINLIAIGTELKEIKYLLQGTDSIAEEIRQKQLKEYEEENKE